MYSVVNALARVKRGEAQLKRVEASTHEAGELLIKRIKRSEKARASQQARVKELTAPFHAAALRAIARYKEAGPLYGLDFIIGGISFGFYPEHARVDMWSRLQDSKGNEPDEDFDSAEDVQEIAASLKPFLDAELKTDGLEYSLGELHVPSTYFTK